VGDFSFAQMGANSFTFESVNIRNASRPIGWAILGYAHIQNGHWIRKVSKPTLSRRVGEAQYRPYH
jgi:hypothetical protein